MSFFEIIGALLLVQGIFFTAVAAIGLIRLPDVYNRLHASSKALTLGALGVLFSTLGLSGPDLSLRSIAAGIFILLTAPVAATVIARAAYRRGVPLAEQSILDEMADDEIQLARDEFDTGEATIRSNRSRQDSQPTVAKKAEI